ADIEPPCCSQRSASRPARRRPCSRVRGGWTQSFARTRGRSRRTRSVLLDGGGEVKRERNGGCGMSAVPSSVDRMVHPVRELFSVHRGSSSKQGGPHRDSTPLLHRHRR